VPGMMSYAAEIHRGEIDDVILDSAFNTGRILITEDKDFGELVYRFRKSSKGIILIRIPIQDRRLKWLRLKVLIEKHSERLSGSFVVVDTRKFRFRPLLFKL
jgi:predicted nuclease of predicted toxin-antitoxin system